MSWIFRHAIFVSRKQPYLEWANALPNDDGAKVTEELARETRTVYLVPETMQDKEFEAIVDEFWRPVFEEELAAWSEDDTQWPKELTRELFDAWFDIETNRGVYDLTPDEPLTQSDLDAEDLLIAMRTCAGCGAELEHEQGRELGFNVADRALLAPFRGRPLPLPVDDEQVILCIVATDEDGDAVDGDDLLVRVCSRGCENAVRKVVPKALKKWERTAAANA